MAANCNSTFPSAEFAIPVLPTITASANVYPLPLFVTSIVSTANIEVFTIALASAPVPSPVIVTLGDISNNDVVSTLENPVSLASNTLLADPVTIYSLITADAPLPPPAPI